MQTYIISNYQSIWLSVLNIIILIKSKYFFPFCVHVISHPNFRVQLAIVLSSVPVLVHNILVMHAWKTKYIYQHSVASEGWWESCVDMCCQQCWRYATLMELLPGFKGKVCSWCFMYFDGVDKQLNYGMNKHGLCGSWWLWGSFLIKTAIFVTSS